MANISNKRHRVYVGAFLLLVAVLIGSAVIYAHDRRLEQTKQTETTAAQVEQILQADTRTLDGCLTKAVLDYSNYIKQNSEVTVTPAGEQSYMMSPEDWGIADGKLQSDRNNCELIHGRSQ